MSTTPTTKSQVQASRFVLRRMESALVRKDAVMLHEPMRHHLRASAVGVIVSLLGLAAFFVVGLFRPTSEISGNEIVISSSSNSVYVVQDNPRRLIPVRSLTSARLLLAAISPGRVTPEAKTVEEAALAGIARAPTTGIEGLPPLPSSENVIRGIWSVCDTAAVGPDLPNAASAAQLSTTVLIQEQPPQGRPLGDDSALLVAERSAGVTYLVWRGRRAQVNLRDTAVQTHYQMGNVVPRQVSAGLLNAIPEGPPLTLPVIPTGQSFPQLPGVQVGDVVRVRGARDSYFLVLPQGVQRLEPAVAELIRYRHSDSPEITSVTPQDIAQVPVAPLASQLDFTGFPTQVPQLIETTDAPIVCLTRSGPDQAPVITVHSGLPLDEGESPVQVPRAASGRTADSVVLQPTKGVLVRGVVAGQNPDVGAIWLVTDQGVRYGVPSLEVARAIGLGESTSPAPEPILGLLPIGMTLDPQAALELFDPEQARQQVERRPGG